MSRLIGTKHNQYWVVFRSSIATVERGKSDWSSRYRRLNLHHMICLSIENDLIALHVLCNRRSLGPNYVLTLFCFHCTQDESMNQMCAKWFGRLQLYRYVVFIRIPYWHEQKMAFEFLWTESVWTGSIRLCFF